MHYLVYVSSATYLFDDIELENLLVKSRNNNLKQGITGVLFYHEGNIIQVLEGEAWAVKRVYERIKLDNRHSGIIKLIEGSTQERNFSNWSMGFSLLSTENMEHILSYKNRSTTVANTEPCNEVAPYVQQGIYILLQTFFNNNIRRNII